MRTKRLRPLVPLLIVCSFCVIALADRPAKDHLSREPSENLALPLQTEGAIWSERYLRFLLDRRLKAKGDTADPFIELWNEMKGLSWKQQPQRFFQRLSLLLQTLKERDPKGLSILTQDEGAAGGFAKGLFPEPSQKNDKEAVKRILLEGKPVRPSPSRELARTDVSFRDQLANIDKIHVLTDKDFGKSRTTTSLVTQAKEKDPLMLPPTPRPPVREDSLAEKVPPKGLKVTRTLVQGTPFGIFNGYSHVALPSFFDRNRLFIVENPYANQLTDVWNTGPLSTGVLRAAGMDVRFAANPKELARRIEEKFNETGQPVRVVAIGHGIPGVLGMGKGTLAEMKPELELRYGPETEELMKRLKGKVKDVLLISCSVAKGLNSPLDKHLMAQMAKILNVPVEGYDETVFVNDRTPVGGTGFWSTFPTAHRVRVEPIHS